MAGRAGSARTGREIMANPSPNVAPVSSAKAIILEALMVALAGALLAFAANFLSPRGLHNLTRNYFPASKSLPLVTNSIPTQTPTNLEAQLQGEGLQLADLKKASDLFHDARYQQGGVLFVDARDEQNYQAGHIPGAYMLNWFHPENYLGTVLPLCNVAQQIVVYCSGGDCELSQSTAMLLRDSQVAKEKLFVYAGGITEWTNHGLPIEIGERNSGQIQTPSKTP
jgi:rhodanese-related sulfurtransferase